MTKEQCDQLNFNDLCRGKKKKKKNCDQELSFRSKTLMPRHIYQSPS